MINILIPKEYTQYSKREEGINISTDCVEEQQINIAIYNVIEVIDITIPVIGLDLSAYTIEDIRKTLEKVKGNVSIFLVKDIEEYETLHYLLNISKDNIYIKNKDKIIALMLEDLIKRYRLKNNLFKNFLKKDNWKGEYKSVNLKEDQSRLIINSTAKKDEVQYLSYISQDIDRFKSHKKSYRFYIEGLAETDVNCKIFIVLYKNNQKKDTLSIEIGQDAFILPNNEYDEFEVKIRIQGTGAVLIEEAICIEISNLDNELGIRDVQEESYLVLANAYPSRNQLYKNGFIHRRVKYYKEKGLNIDIYTQHTGEGMSIYMYDGVKVYTGGDKGLLYLLQNKKYTKVLIHFPNQKMIELIKESGLNPEMIIWIHGFGAERYTRRLFDYSKQYLEQNERLLQERDNKQMVLMKELYMSEKVATVYVSDYIWKVAEEDAQCSTYNPVIIPNIIDSNLFEYRKKNIHQRKRILMIRPFVAPKYGCDIAVNTILELSKKEFFDELIISIYGEGPLFEKILEPIKQFKNIDIHETFLPQEEIARLHKNYGIMLLPTRHDTQGVSMGEAMSSGLVVATNKVWAIPEYIDDDCGMLSDDGDYVTLAEKIEDLYYNPDKFLELSLNAAKRVREQCSVENTIERECKLIKA